MKQKVPYNPKIMYTGVYIIQRAKPQNFEVSRLADAKVTSVTTGDLGDHGEHICTKKGDRRQHAEGVRFITNKCGYEMKKKLNLSFFYCKTCLYWSPMVTKLTKLTSGHRGHLIHHTPFVCIQKNQKGDKK